MTRTIDALGGRLMAGVSLPDSPLITEALEYARKVSEPYLFNHAVRSWLFAAKAGQLKNIDCDLEVLAIGTHAVPDWPRLAGGSRGAHR